MVASLVSSLTAGLAVLLLLLLIAVAADEAAVQHDCRSLPTHRRHHGNDDCKDRLGEEEEQKCADRLRAGGRWCLTNVWTFVWPKAALLRDLVPWDPDHHCCRAVLQVEKEAKRCWCSYYRQVGIGEQEIRSNKKNLIKYCVALLKSPDPST